MDNIEPKWYVLHTYSGYENVAKENLETMTVKYGLEDRIMDIVIPMEDVIQEKNGKKKFVQRKTMPGYLLVKMRYGDDIWHNVTRTRGVTGFTGPKGRPLELTPEEVQRMKLEKVVVERDIVPGDKVEIIDERLNGFIGEIIAVDEKNSKYKVSVEMFGRKTPVDIEFEKVIRVPDNN